MRFIARVLIGPAALGLLDLADLGDQARILEEAVLATLGVALVGEALRLPVGYSSSNRRLLFVLLGIGMPLMWYPLNGTDGAQWRFAAFLMLVAFRPSDETNERGPLSEKTNMTQQEVIR